MPSATLSGEVQQKGPDGIWRTILTATGFTLRDYRRHPVDEAETIVFGYVWAPYVPGKAGAYSPFRMTGGV